MVRSRGAERSSLVIEPISHPLLASLCEMLKPTRRQSCTAQNPQPNNLLSIAFAVLMGRIDHLARRMLLPVPIVNTYSSSARQSPSVTTGRGLVKRNHHPLLPLPPYLITNPSPRWVLTHASSLTSHRQRSSVGPRTREKRRCMRTFFP
jgi:hypothetical protein